MLTDTHAHLEMKAFRQDLDEVVSRARESGVSTIITVGSTLKASQEAVELAERYECVYAAAGIHPHDAEEGDAAALKTLRKLLEHPRVVALGEIGLDYYRDYSPRDVQREVFREQIGIAREAELPIIVHSREAHDDTMRILEEEEAGRVKGIMHCFSGDGAMAEKCIEMGLLISFAGPLTYSNSRKLQEVASHLHLDHLVVETDCPFLPPEPRPGRGKRNEPAYVRSVAEKLAELHGLTVEDVARVTTLNVHRLLGVGEIESQGQLAYRIRDSLYLNVTNECTNHCTFCMRFFTDYVKGHNLRLQSEPTVEELWKAVEDADDGFEEVVFCGYGEPTLRLDVVKELAGRLKARGMKTRLDTNGHGNLIHKRNILPELHGLIDSLVVSLNAQNALTYEKLCQPSFEQAYQGVKDFVLEAKDHIPDVSVSVVSVPHQVDLSECRRIVREELGVKFRVREYNVFG
jgi:TatD DNase family protein